METKRLTATERESMMRMYIAMDLLHEAAGNLGERAKLVPYAKRDLGMMRAKVLKLLNQFTLTVPADQMKTFTNCLKMASFTVGVKAPGKPVRDDRTYGMWLPYADLEGLLKGCRDHCDMCPADKQHRMSCDLRKVLDAIPNDSAPRDDGDCPYFVYM